MRTVVVGASRLLITIAISLIAANATPDEMLHFIRAHWLASLLAALVCSVILGPAPDTAIERDVEALRQQVKWIKKDVGRA